MKYFIRSIDSKDSEWNLFEQKMRSCATYYVHSLLEKDDIVLLYSGKQNSEVACGVHAIGIAETDATKEYDIYKEKEVYKAKIKIVYIDYNKDRPIIDECSMEMFMGKTKIIRNMISIKENIEKLEEILAKYIGE